MHAGEAAPGLPDAIGPYRILRLLGEGGMGRVYLAREAHPPRDVALKVVRGPSAGLAARLRREVEALATLEHAGIARLYAAGEACVDGASAPWFAMEYVRGADLLQHAEAQACDLAERVRLAACVARAVQHAHAHGVVHRDLKPGNILVDASGQPKVLDFGIAHRFGSDAPELTQAGQVLGTLPYMSPEQLDRGGRGADVRSDVYALGAITYELLAGRLPQPRLAGATLFEALDILRGEPPVPLAEVAPAARGDLGTVVMKALAADPALRYASAAAFADDLERVLAHRPVLARPPSAAYRVLRFARRHRALSAALLVVFAALAGASAVSLRFAWSERAAHAEAELRAREAAAVNAFLQRMLASANPESTGGRNPTVAQLVDEAQRGLDALAQQPRVLGAVAATLSGARRALGDYAEALALNDRALAAAGETLPAAQRQALLRERATILTELARFDDARAALAQARAAWPAASLPLRMELDLALTRIDSDEGRVDEAERGLRTLLAQAADLPAALAAGHELQATLATARSSLSTILRDQGHLDEAERLTREVLAWRRQALGERAPATLASRHNLALVLGARGDHAGAAAEARSTLALQREILGERHSGTLTTWQTLANLLIAQGRLDEAEAAARASLEGFEREAGEAHVQTLAAMNTLAYILEERRRLDEAEALYRRILAIQERAGTRHPSTFAPRNNLAMLLLGAGRLEEAREGFARLVEDAQAALGAEHLMTAIFRSNEGGCLARMGRLAEARAALEAAHAQLLALVGADHARTRTAAERLADVYDRLGEHARAAALREGTRA